VPTQRAREFFGELRKKPRAEIAGTAEVLLGVAPIPARIGVVSGTLGIFAPWREVFLSRQGARPPRRKGAVGNGVDHGYHGWARIPMNGTPGCVVPVWRQHHTSNLESRTLNFETSTSNVQPPVRLNPTCLRRSYSEVAGDEEVPFGVKTIPYGIGVAPRGTWRLWRAENLPGPLGGGTLFP